MPAFAFGWQALHWETKTCWPAEASGADEARLVDTVGTLEPVFSGSAGVTAAGPSAATGAGRSAASAARAPTSQR